MTEKIIVKIGDRLISLRKRKSMTLDKLAEKSGVSKSILSQIERDMSNPTVSTISRIAGALNENLSDFFSKIEIDNATSIKSSEETPSIISKDGLCTLNILGAGETVNWLQWYLLSIKPNGILDSTSHGPRTFENLTVLDGEIVVEIESDNKKIKNGDTFRFQTNKRHIIKNLSKKNAKVLMVNYIDPVKGSFD
tara:strand:+ start:412 stop:993 length:582 start_codon:yes stop_codon:yes gene_type:complete